MKNRLPLLLLAGLTLLRLLASCATHPTHQPRPPAWATPIALEGVPNLHRVSESLYRSAQPTALGMQNLEEMGIKTVINLRTFSDDQDEVTGTSLKRIDIPMLAWLPQDRSADEFLAEIANETNGPYLVHCLHGADRTGSLTALYRVHAQQWTPSQATHEMLSGGYGYHRIWKRLRTWTERQTADHSRP